MKLQPMTALTKVKFKPHESITALPTFTDHGPHAWIFDGAVILRRKAIMKTSRFAQRVLSLRTAVSRNACSLTIGGFTSEESAVCKLIGFTEDVGDRWGSNYKISLLYLQRGTNLIVCNLDKFRILEKLGIAYDEIRQAKKSRLGPLMFFNEGTIQALIMPILPSEKMIPDELKRLRWEMPKAFRPQTWRGKDDG